jgi:hypothetical protein
MYEHFSAICTKRNNGTIEYNRWNKNNASLLVKFMTSRTYDDKILERT